MSGEYAWKGWDAVEAYHVEENGVDVEGLDVLGLRLGRHGSNVWLRRKLVWMLG